MTIMCPSGCFGNSCMKLFPNRNHKISRQYVIQPKIYLSKTPHGKDVGQEVCSEKKLKLEQNRDFSP